MSNRSRCTSVLLLLALSACADHPTSVQPALVVRQSDIRSPLDASAYDVVDVGMFNGLATMPLEVDKLGVIYGRVLTPSTLRSFRWTSKDGFEDLGDFDGLPFNVLTANDHGLLNGYVFVPNVGNRAVAWLPQRGFVYLDPGYRGITGGNNNRGAIVGGRQLVGSSQAYVWTEADGVTLIPLAISDTTIVSSGAADINEDGTVAGGLTFQPASGQRRNRAYVWDAARGTRLIPPLVPDVGIPANVGVTCVSDEGIVVGASEARAPLPGELRSNPVVSSNPIGTVPIHAWKWSETTGLVDLGTLGGIFSAAWDVDQDGNVYGWASDAAGLQHAVKWTTDGNVLDLGGLGGNTLTGGITKHGLVVGWSVTPAGEVHAVQFVPRKK